jgi:hypothetical protein
MRFAFESRLDYASESRNSTVITDHRGPNDRKAAHIVEAHGTSATSIAAGDLPHVGLSELR